ncbi:MAG TPA: orotate phosphoribosyltransferase [Verrucomicrobiae bacterium]|jgi:orotate phosphoribosyltransferase|nr:orotate phosphoribosyltransferase [Verrucomicrobiae bacterium]
MEDKKLRDDLLQLVKEKALIKGERTLASGKKSSFYIDGKQVTLDPQGIFLTAKLIHNLIQGNKADAIGGPTLGADPIVAAVSLLSSQSGHPIKALIVRKEAKDHGTQKMIEGPALKEGDRVVMVEDVITTGGSVLKAIQEIEKLKAKVVRVVCLVDRDEGADKTLAPYNYTPIFFLSDIGVKKE